MLAQDSRRKASWFQIPAAHVPGQMIQRLAGGISLVRIGDVLAKSEGLIRHIDGTVLIESWAMIGGCEGALLTSCQPAGKLQIRHSHRPAFG